MIHWRLEHDTNYKDALMSNRLPWIDIFLNTMDNKIQSNLIVYSSFVVVSENKKNKKENYIFS